MDCGGMSMARYKKDTDYIVYDIATDMPVVLGTVEECSKFLNIKTPNRFYGLVWKTRMNKASKYEVYNLDELLKDYNENE